MCRELRQVFKRENELSRNEVDVQCNIMKASGSLSSEKSTTNLHGVVNVLKSLISYIAETLKD